MVQRVVWVHVPAVQTFAQHLLDFTAVLLLAHVQVDPHAALTGACRKTRQAALVEHPFALERPRDFTVIL